MGGWIFDAPYRRVSRNELCGGVKRGREHGSWRVKQGSEGWVRLGKAVEAGSHRAGLRTVQATLKIVFSVGIKIPRKRDFIDSYQAG